MVPICSDAVITGIEGRRSAAENDVRVWVGCGRIRRRPADLAFQQEEAQKHAHDN